MSKNFLPHASDDSLLGGFGKIIITVIAGIILARFGITKQPPDIKW